MSAPVPDGFAPWERSSPFLDAVGPFYLKRDGDGLVWGLRIEERHTNRRGFAHGGLLVTLADITLGHTAAASQDPPALAVTVNLTTDFAGSARIGDWIEARADVQKVGKRVVFANCYLTVAGERIVRASAVFSRTDAA
jgi:uncharacterized protein (TIGR00369 family)